MGFVIGVFVAFAMVGLLALAVVLVTLDIIRRILIRKKSSFTYIVLVVVVYLAASVVLIPFLATGGIDRMFSVY